MVVDACRAPWLKKLIIMTNDKVACFGVASELAYMVCIRESNIEFS